MMVTMPAEPKMKDNRVQTADPNPPAMPSKRRNGWMTWLVRLVKAAVSAGLLYLLVRMIKAESLTQAISTANLFPMLLAAALLPINLWLQAMRWHTLVRTEFDHISFGRIFASLLGGLSLGLVTPGRVGEVGRVFLLDVPSRMRLAGLHVLDKMYFVSAVALLGPAMLYLMPGFSDALPASIRPGTSILVAILPLAYFALALSPTPLKSLLLAVQIAVGAKGRTLELLRAYEGVRTVHCVRLTLLTMIQFLLILTQFFLLSLAFEPVSWFTAAHTYAAALFMKTALPVSLGSLGVGEWATVSFYARYGIADTTGFSASLILFGMNVLLPGLAGLWVLFRMRPQALLRRLGFRRGVQS
jgi:uncharacterized membrane protein YbhN (UPF0104 family)